MKMKLLLLTILFGALFFSLNAQEKKSTDPCTNCGSARDSVLLQLNSGEEIIVVKRSAQQLSVAQSEMAKRRKYFDCPDILAPVEREKTPEIEKPVERPIEAKPEIKEIKKEPFFLPDPVFFRINKWVIDQAEWAKIELAVNYLNEHPGATCVLTGYADKKTGNSAINQRLSKQRSEAVAKAMEEKYGIAKNRLSVNWKGDGIQPFQLENDKNRAVLFLINP